MVLKILGKIIGIEINQIFSVEIVTYCIVVWSLFLLIQKCKLALFTQEKLSIFNSLGYYTTPELQNIDTNFLTEKILQTNKMTKIFSGGFCHGNFFCF